MKKHEIWVAPIFYIIISTIPYLFTLGAVAEFGNWGGSSSTCPAANRSPWIGLLIYFSLFVFPSLLTLYLMHRINLSKMQTISKLLLYLLFIPSSVFFGILFPLLLIRPPSQVINYNSYEEATRICDVYMGKTPYFIHLLYWLILPILSVIISKYLTHSKSDKNDPKPTE